MSPVERIASRQNQVVKRIRGLAHRDRDGQDVLLDGPHLLEEALTQGISVDVAAFAEPFVTGRLAKLAERTRAAGAKVVVVSEDVLRSMSPVRHPTGVVAIARAGPVSLACALGHPPQLVLMLGGIQDPGNVGAIVRTADACGATGVVATAGTADPFAWKALRGAMGSAFRVPLAVCESLSDAVSRARDSGLRILVAVARGGRPLPQCDLARPAAVLLGSEGAGVPDTLVAAADERLTIPMRTPVESLNVAVAAALILYEADRQRSHGKS